MMIILIDHLIKEWVSWYDIRSKANFFHSSVSIIAGDQLSESRLFSDVVGTVLRYFWIRNDNICDGNVIYWGLML